MRAISARGVVDFASPMTDTSSAVNTTENTYLRDAVLTASPEQLHLMLYDGAIKNATQARDAILQKDFATSFDRLTKAQNIINEMQAGLNYEVNRELCQQVAAVYNFIFRRLVDANVNRDVNAIDDALKVLRIERSTWQMLVEKVTSVREAGCEPSLTPVRQFEGISVQG